MGGAIAAFLTPFKPVQAAVIDFDDVDSNSHRYSYTEDGFILSTPPNLGGMLIYTSGYSNYQGSNAIGSPGWSAIIELKSSDGSLFDLISMDINKRDELYYKYPTVTVTFTGTKADSSTITTQFTTDDDISTKETFYFSDDFTDLVSVSWANDFPFSQIDNIHVVSRDSVPEPLTILGAGTAIAFGTTFKRKVSKKSQKK